MEQAGIVHRRPNGQQKRTPTFVGATLPRASGLNRLRKYDFQTVQTPRKSKQADDIEIRTCVPKSQSIRSDNPFIVFFDLGGDKA